MAQPPEQSCESCRYYHFVTEHVQLCQRYPPSGMGSQGWPSVKTTDWCGEWSGGGPPAQQHRGR